MDRTQALLARAQKNYSEGTEFICMKNGRIYKSLGIFSLSRNGVKVKCETGKILVCHVQLGYFNQWAEIKK